MAIFRCVQESLTNVMKHADATRAHIDIGEKAGRLHIAIEDNGRGVSAGSTWGLGITAMRERVRSLKGVSAIDSSPNGTKVTVELPLRDGASP
ncbi:ATP-binding protein, partial [Microbacteriaceae bacterium K1510]|nr:ATP-binding protein [Microbacteriaceae bacterium K1510]